MLLLEAAAAAGGCRWAYVMCRRSDLPAPCCCCLPPRPRPSAARPQSEKPLLRAEKKRGKDTFTAVYGPRDEAAQLSWSRKPFKVRRRGQGRGPVLGAPRLSTAWACVAAGVRA